MSIKKVIVSGGFDPVHIGHLRMFQEAAKLGDYLIVIVNNDNFLNQKKGKSFMPSIERQEIIRGFSCVDEVVESLDADMSVCKTIESLAVNHKINIFANGGDRKIAEDILESEICKKLNIELVFNVGGDKIQSSSSLTYNFFNQDIASNEKILKPWGYYEVLHTSNFIKLKKLIITPGQSLSLQYHKKRSEFWVMLKGTANIQINQEKYIKNEGENIYIPIGSQHRICNKSEKNIEIIELAMGEYIEEDDITRIEDFYGRADD